jgi:hypothetical protein
MRDRSLSVFLTLLGLCLLGVVTGVLFLISPFWAGGGLVGWMSGYEPTPEKDPFLIV